MNPVSTSLFTTNVQNPGGNCSTKTCGSVDCSAAGVVVPELDLGAFQMTSEAGGNKTVNGVFTLDGNGNTQTDYKDITVNSGGELNFSPNGTGTTVYRIKKLTMKSGSVVKLQPGDYWIDTLKINGNSSIEVVGATGVARIFVNNNLNNNHVKSWNIGGSPSRFFMYGYGNIYLGGNGTQIKGVIYSKGKFRLKHTSTLTGAITAEEVKLINTATIFGTTLDYNTLCGDGDTNYFEVVGPENASHCSNTDITITIKDSNGSTITNYTGGITIDTQDGNGTWLSTTGVGVFSGGTPNGIATYQFVSGDNGTITLSLDYPQAGTTPVTVKVFQTNDTGVVGVSNAINVDLNDVCGETTHFEVVGPGTADSCENATITVTAKNATNTTVIGYVGTVQVDTQSSTGVWVSTTGGGTFNGGTNNGLATYQFVAGDSGTTTFQLSYPPAGPTPITVKVHQISNPSILGLSSLIDFIYNNIIISGTPNGPMFVDTQIAADEFTLYLNKREDNTCVIDQNFDGNKLIRFWTTYNNPTSGTINTLINGAAVASSSGETPTNQTINFVDGVGSLVVRYDDAGQIQMFISHDTDGQGTLVFGSTSPFVVKPLKFLLNVIGNSASQVLSPPTAAEAACLANAPFRKAGEAFGVEVQAVNFLGGVTPNYGNEVVPEGVVLKSSALLAPIGGRNGSTNAGAIQNAATFTKITNNSGTFSAPPYFAGSSFAFDEVGCIELTGEVASGSYLGTGQVSGLTVVGRFIPDHFSVTGNTPEFQPANSGVIDAFTYLEQPFTYSTIPSVTVTARAVGNTTTQNYSGAFWKLSTAGLGALYNKGYYPVNVGDTIPNLPISIGALPAFTDEGNGSGRFDFLEGPGLRIEKLADVLVPPFNAEIQLQISAITDSDGTACTGAGCVSGGFSFGETTAGNGIAFTGIDSKKFYHGRLAILEATGSELLPITTTLRIEYYTSASEFILNEIDSMTNLTSAADLVLTPSSGLVTTPSFPSLAFSNGALNLDFSAPNIAGHVDLELDISTGGANLPWLQYNWPYTAVPVTNFSLNPRGRVTFGIFEGEPNVIFETEVYP